MKISPKYDIEAWKILRFSNEADWTKAIEIIEDRIVGRFLKPISMIEEYEFAGFAIMALDCLLIETLEQFIQGKPRTPNKKESYYFVTYLTNTAFKYYFDENKARIFYKQFRCGILHQAETEKKSLIKVAENQELVSYTDNKKSLIINRKHFHNLLEKTFQDYLIELRNPDNEQLRANFKKKMDYICRLTA